MTKKLSCFKAYDIRGKLGDELNDEIAYRIGRAYGEFLSPESIVVGGDIRLTSESLKLSLSQGLLDSGVNVIDLGVTGTEEIYFATTYLKVDGGIEITASHNPINYNGMKLVSRDSRPISGDSGLNEIKRIAEENNFAEDDTISKGIYKKVDILKDYVEKLFSFIDTDLFIRPLKIVFNAGNGAAGHVLDEIEKEFKNKKVPIEFIKINNNPDGNFPNGIPNPLLPDSRADTIDAVINNKADMGVAFDGDFDRCFLFDESGRFIEGYYIVGLLAESFLEKNRGQKIIHDPRLSWNTIDIVNRNGGVPILSKTGHAFIKEIMRSEDAVYGGEMSAHHYFRDFYYCDSGMIPWMLVAELVIIKNQALSKLVDDRIIKFPASGEINISLNDPDKAIKYILDRYKDNSVSVDYIDGISLEFEDWRFNLRCSNTEPVVRLNVETKGDSVLLTNKTTELLSALKRF